MLLRLSQICIYLLCLLTLAGCQSEENTASFDWRAAVDFPASFSGTLPCADCPGIDYRLNLFADQSFFLRTDYLDREPGRFFQLGRWQLHNENTLVLLSDQQNFRFAINGENNLLLLNQQGQIIDSEHNYQLSKDVRFKPVYPQLMMHGLYRANDEQPTFEECLSGQRWSVATTPDHETLQKRYDELRQAAGEALLISAQAELIAHDDTPAIAIHTFTGIWPGETCGRVGFKESLLDTYWKLTRLYNQPVIVHDGQREPSITLASGDDLRVSGSDGCNRIMGSFQVKDNKLKFNKMASTMMACPSDSGIAQRYHEALEQVQFWRIQGQHLELSDKDGKTLARFQAVHL